MSDKKRLPPLIQGFGAENVLRLLDSLKSTPDGSVIYRHVSHSIQEMERSQNKICLGYATLLMNMIKSMRQQLPVDSLLNLELKMIQTRLAPPITITELSAIQSYLNKTVSIMNQLATPEEKYWLQLIKPLLDVFSNEAFTEISQSLDSLQKDKSQPTYHQPLEEDLGHFDSKEIHVDELDSRSDISLSHVATTTTDDEHAPQEEFSEQQTNLMSSIFDAMQHQARFGLLLEDMLQRLQKAENKQDVVDVRGHAINELQQMLTEQSSLVRTLNETQNFANRIQESGQLLSKELNQVRILSLTDELTELPNRRAFISRLNDEFQRAKRYKSSFSVALIDLDEFKKINDTYGHLAGDEMLRCYATEILSIFRVSDLVARYGGEEFAVIFPNTTVKESLSALEKAQALAFTVSVEFDDEDIRAPSFSAGLVSYRPNEKPEALLNRADKLLYRAKNNGRRHIEVEESTDKHGIPVLNGKSK